VKQDEQQQDPPSETQFVADRCDIWRTAYATMKSVGIEDPEPADVMELAEFLAGDHLRPDDDAD